MFPNAILLLLLLLPLSVLAHSSAPAPLTIPTHIACPHNMALVRSAGPPGKQTLSPAEKTYIAERASKVLPGAWKAYLKNVKSTSPTPLPRYVSSIMSSESPHGTLPKLGIAVSGGSLRAALYSAGVLSSMDGRNASAAKKTGTGGILQVASYMSALSGGAWTVTALAQANFPTIADLVFPPPPSQAGDPAAAFGGFLAQVDVTSPGPDANGTLAYLELLLAEVAAKHAAGFPVTITDVWARALSRHFVNGTTAQDILGKGTHGAGILFSDITKQSSFISRQQPFPIIMAESFSPKLNISEIIPGRVVPLTNELWEFNVYESGSFDPSLSSFTPTEFLGSTNSSTCIKGYDQMSFVAGVSSNIFSQLNTSEAAIRSSIAGPLISLINSTFPQTGIRLDSAAVPNPFMGVKPATYSNTNETIVTLTDGGSDGDIVPFQPLLVQAREVDTIIALDADDNTADSFANGTTLIISARRAALFGRTYPFPAVPPSADEFIQQGLTRRPTFFGCDDTSGAPLIIYIANGGPPASGAAPVTNSSNAQLAFPPAQVQAIVDQAFEIATQGKPVAGSQSRSRSDPEWGACLACAVVDRARARMGARREGVCGACLERYCWTQRRK